MKCKACPTEIVFLPTNKVGKFEPVEITSLSDDDVTRLASHQTVFFNHTRHISHFSDCPCAKSFRKPKSQLELL